METIIIALLFRVTISKKTPQEEVDYILFVVEGLLVNPDFQDVESLALINALKNAAIDAGKAITKAESKATADIKAKNVAVKDMNKAYKKMALKAEEVCDGDEEMAGRTGLILRKKKSKKNANQPQDVKADSGKQEGEIDARCKSLGQGFSYLWQIRKVGETGPPQTKTTVNKASVTFSDLESGAKYEVRVLGFSANSKSKPSDVALARAT